MLDSKNMRSMASLALSYSTVFIVLMLLEALIALGGRGETLYQSSITARITYGALSRITATISNDRSFFGVLSIAMFTLGALWTNPASAAESTSNRQLLHKTGSRALGMLAFQFLLEALVPMRSYGSVAEELLWACLVVGAVGILSTIPQLRTIALFCSWAIPGAVTRYLRFSGLSDPLITIISLLIFVAVYCLDWVLDKFGAREGIPETAVMTSINFFGSMAAVLLTNSLENTSPAQTLLIILLLLYTTALMLRQDIK